MTDLVMALQQVTPIVQVGPGLWAGPCPYHTEPPRSLRVVARTEQFKCFTCGWAGGLEEVRAYLTRARV
jgi:CHC2-type zinc finger protein